VERRAAIVEGIPAGLDPVAYEQPIGWTSAAIAVHSILQIPQPMFLRLEPAGFGPITIDFRHHAFEWGTPLSEFPDEPATVLVETEPTTADEPPLFELPGSNLDRLLWVMGLHSFQDDGAFWLRSGDRFRLSRWPDLTTLEHSMDQMRMIAMLGNIALTVEQLATAADVPLADAQRLINALSLMGVLESSAETSAAVIEQPVPAASTHRGLFSRLREKLGL
jgi:hypothetical protein